MMTVYSFLGMRRREQVRRALAAWRAMRFVRTSALVERGIAAAFRAAFPDLRWHVDLLLAEGDLVAGRWTASGTNTGPWAGVAATGKHATFSGVNIFRIRDGKVVEIWNHRDDLGLAQQLGAPVYAGASPQDDHPSAPA